MIVKLDTHQTFTKYTSSTNTPLKISNSLENKLKFSLDEISVFDLGFNVCGNMRTFDKNKFAQDEFKFVSCHQLDEYLSKYSTTVTTEDKDNDRMWHNWVNKNSS